MREGEGTRGTGNEFETWRGLGREKRQRMEAVTSCTFGETNLINGPGRAQSQGGYIREERARGHTEASCIVRRSERGINNNSHIWPNKRACIHERG